jgi:hypothetical protein
MIGVIQLATDRERERRERREKRVAKRAEEDGRESARDPFNLDELIRTSS